MKQSLDFIVIGAQKSGTTTLFEYLRQHPELYLPSGKEAPFYSHDSEWNDGWSEYVRHYFALASEARRWGTVTPHYMYGSLYQAAEPERLATVSRPELLVPERIASHSPEARLIAILRDPVERAYSHFRMECFRETEQRTFDAAIDDLLDPLQLERSRRQPTEVTAYVTNGEYGRILSPYFELFGGDRILVCFVDDLAANPETTFASILRFLDVASDFQPPNLGQRYRVAGSRRRLRQLDPDRFQRRVASSRHLRSAWHALPGGLRERIDRGFKEFTYQADVRNRIVEPRAEMPSQHVEERLRAHYALDRETLRLLIDREPQW
jgi:Sulfotransferase family